jgi:hypothetical protein
LAFNLSCKLARFAGLRSGAEQDKAKGAPPPGIIRRHTVPLKIQASIFFGEKMLPLSLFFYDVKITTNYQHKND